MQRYEKIFYLTNRFSIFNNFFYVKITLIFCLYFFYYRSAITQQLILEAEDAFLQGTLTKQVSYSGYSGTGYVGNFSNDSDKLIFKFVVDSNSYYQLYIRYIAPYGNKNNILYINENSIEVFYPSCNKFSELNFGRIKLSKDSNTIIIAKSWGWFFIDCLKLITVNPDSLKFNLPYKLSTPEPSEESLRLFHFLCSYYGKNIISGVMEKSEADWLKQKTGKYPALLGQDFMNHTRTYSWFNKNQIITNSINWYNQNGIITICWHWRDPSGNTDEFYTNKTNFDVSKIFDSTSTEYKFMLNDIDTIAKYLKKLQSAHIPILFRPLHEASGGWFWWGAKGPEACKKLWKTMFDRIVKFHGINNLIWVWTTDASQENLQWYPGDSVVDILGLDIYSSSGDFSSKILYFNKVKESFQAKKIITLSENGVIPDPDKLITDEAYFSYFMTWFGSFVRDSSINPLTHWQKVLNHNYVITLDEMPNLKTYPLLAEKKYEKEKSSKQIDNKFEIRISNNNLIIKLLDENIKFYNVSIYNLLGIKLKTLYKLYGENIIPLNKYTPCGIYLINIFSDTFIEIHKILINKN